MLTDQAPTDAARVSRQEAEPRPEPFGLPTMRVMSLADWIAVPDNPRQRDTESRAGRAVHLDKFDPTHAVVHMATLPDGSRYKLDGHTRTHKWLHNPAMAPKVVTINDWPCRDVEAVVELYTRFDSRKAVETGVDQLAGAVRLAGIEYTSPLLRSGRYGSAIKRLYQMIYGRFGKWTDEILVGDAVAEFRSELIALDKLHPTTHLFPAGIIMAFCATHRVRGAASMEFWEKYAARAGTKNKGAMDAPQALLETALATKRERAGVDSTTALIRVFNKGVTAYCGWERRETYLKGLKLMSDENLRAFYKMPPALRR